MNVGTYVTNVLLTNLALGITCNRYMTIESWSQSYDYEIYNYNASVAVGWIVFSK
jgi:hypothetical protein